MADGAEMEEEGDEGKEGVGEGQGRAIAFGRAIVTAPTDCHSARILHLAKKTRKSLRRKNNLPGGAEFQRISAQS